MLLLHHPASLPDILPHARHWVGKLLSLLHTLTISLYWVLSCWALDTVGELSASFCQDPMPAGFGSTAWKMGQYSLEDVAVQLRGWGAPLMACQGAFATEQLVTGGAVQLVQDDVLLFGGLVTLLVLLLGPGSHLEGAGPFGSLCGLLLPPTPPCQTPDRLAPSSCPVRPRLGPIRLTFRDFLVRG
jgi:hypothetical protein